MDLKAGASIHNRFDIRVIREGKIIQEAYAENIVLDRMYTRICSFATYFDYIHFGTGTGTQSASRTTLFTSRGYKSATVVESVYAFPISKITKKIQLMPEEYIGSVLTEVGISESTSNINTHALIKDAEGINICITKTAIDVIEIYATVYVELPDDVAGNTYWWRPASSNYLLGYLIGGNGFPTTYIATYRNNGGNVHNYVGSYSTIQKSALVYVTHTTWGVARFDINTSNTSICRVGVNGLVYHVVPSTTYSGTDMTNYSLGTGNGVSTSFSIPFDYVSNISVSVDGVVSSDYHLLDSSSPYPQCASVGLGASTNGHYVTPITEDTLLLSETSPGWAITIVKIVDGFPVSLGSLGSFNVGFSGQVGDDFLIQTYNGNTYKISVLNKSTYVLTDSSYISPPGTLCAVNEDWTCCLELGDSYSRDGKMYVYTRTTGSWVKKYTSLYCEGTNKGVYLGNNKFLVIGRYDQGSNNKNIITYNINNTVSAVSLSGTSGYGACHGGFLVSENGTSNSYNMYKWDSVNGVFNLVASSFFIGFGVLSMYRISDGYFIVWDGSTMCSLLWDSVSSTFRAVSQISGTFDTLSSAILTADGELALVSAQYYVSVLNTELSRKTVVFDTPPASGAVVTSSFHTDCIPKTTDYVLDVGFTLQFGEGTI